MALWPKASNRDITYTVQTEDVLGLNAGQHNHNQTLKSDEAK